MNKYIYTYIYIYIYMYEYVYLYIRVCRIRWIRGGRRLYIRIVYIHVYMHICTYVHIYIYIRICTFTSGCAAPAGSEKEADIIYDLYIYTYVYIYVCMNMYIYIRVCSTRWIRGGSQIWPRERASRRAIATALSQLRCHRNSAVTAQGQSSCFRCKLQRLSVVCPFGWCGCEKCGDGGEGRVIYDLN